MCVCRFVPAVCLSDDFRPRCVCLTVDFCLLCVSLSISTHGVSVWRSIFAFVCLSISTPGVSVCRFLPVMSICLSIFTLCKSVWLSISACFVYFFNRFLPAVSICRFLPSVCRSVDFYPLSVWLCLSFCRFLPAMSLCMSIFAFSVSISTPCVSILLWISAFYVCRLQPPVCAMTVDFCLMCVLLSISAYSVSDCRFLPAVCLSISACCVSDCRFLPALCLSVSFCLLCISRFLAAVCLTVYFCMLCVWLSISVYCILISVNWSLPACCIYLSPCMSICDFLPVSLCICVCVFVFFFLSLSSKFQALSSLLVLALM